MYSVCRPEVNTVRLLVSLSLSYCLETVSLTEPEAYSVYLDWLAMELPESTFPCCPILLLQDAQPCPFSVSAWDMNSGPYACTVKCSYPRRHLSSTPILCFQTKTLTAPGDHSTNWLHRLPARPRAPSCQVGRTVSGFFDVGSGDLNLGSHADAAALC